MICVRKISRTGTCVGPVLGAILTLALNNGSISQGIILLSAYSAGLAIPFLIASVQIGLVTTVIRRYGKLMHYVEIAMGILLIIIGALLFLGQYQKIAGFSAAFFSTYNELALGRLILIVLIGLSVLGLLPAFLAHRKGRSFFTWWIFGATLFPVALPLALMLSPQTSEEGSQGDPNDSTTTQGKLPAA
jgi:thiol:disulfide interchange protein